ncbi:F0F1 ATP synthase subunit gamma, partial [Verrucomicrobiota bacterium]
AEVFDAYLSSGGTEMLFIFNVYGGMGRSNEQVRTVLPPSIEDMGEDRPGFSYGPILTASPGELLGHLVEEYFFIELYRALLESHSSENGARLLAMTSAGSNIKERSADLTQEFQSARQDAITAELLDVVGGAEALATVQSYVPDGSP